MKGLFATQALSGSLSSVLLLLRLVSGIAFAFHGWGKIQDPFGWMGAGSDVPGIFQLLAAISEFGGGIAWALGLLTRLASLGLISTMVVAVHMHAVKLGDPFVATGPGQGSYELAAVYLCVGLLLLVTGPGRFSVDRKLFGELR